MDEETGFTIDSKPSREMGYKENFQNAITFELSLSQIYYTRQVYSILDFVADIGGFVSAVGSLCGLIILFL